MTADEHIAASIKRAIEESGFTKRDVAEHLGVSANTVQNWCAAKCAMSMEQAIALCDMLDIGIDELTGRDTSGRPSGLAIIASIYHTVNEDGQRRIVEYAMMVGDNPRFSPARVEFSEVSA